MCEPPSDGPVWRHFSGKWVSCFIPALFLAGLLFFTGCSNADSDSTETIDLDSLPVRIAEPVLSVNAIDTTLFAALYQLSVSLDDSSVIIADGIRKQVFQLNPDGTGRMVADVGRGPGEVQSVNTLVLDPDGYLHLYDRQNARVTKFDRHLTYKSEIKLESVGEDVLVREIYPTAEPDILLVVGTDWRYFNEIVNDRVQVIGLYSSQEGSYSDWLRIPYTRVSFTVIEEIVRAVHEIPYTPMTHIAMHHEGSSFFLYWPPSEEIVELSLSMDTLRVIQVPCLWSDSSIVNEIPY